MSTTLAELETERAAIRTAMTAALTAGQNYSRPGFSLARVQYSQLAERLRVVDSQITRMSTTSGGASSCMKVPNSGSAAEEDDWE